MAPTDPISPNSLLWKQQLRQENAYILKRLVNLENLAEKQNDRIKTAESKIANAENATTAANEESKNFAGNLESGVNQRLSELSKHVSDLQTEQKAITQQVACFQRKQEQTTEEKRQDVGKDQLLLRRIEDVEQGLEKYQENLRLMERHPDETQINHIKQELKSLAAQVKREGDEMKSLAESVRALETANEELRKNNAKLEVEFTARHISAATTSNAATGGNSQFRAISAPYEVTTLATRAPTAHEESPPPDTTRPMLATGEQATSEAPHSEPEQTGVGYTAVNLKKKPHRWSGVRADNEIVRAGLSGNKKGPLLRSKTVAADDAVTKRKVEDNYGSGGKEDRGTVPIGTLIMRESAVVEPEEDVIKVTTPGNKRKPHRWCGIGPDKDIIQKGQFEMMQERNETEHRYPTTGKGSFRTVRSADKYVLHQDDSWTVVPRSPSSDSSPVRGFTRREPVQSLKNATPVFSQPDLLTGGRTTRQKAQQPAHADANKRKIDEISDEDDVVFIKSKAVSTRAARADGRAGANCEDSYVFSSPVPSSPERRDGDTARAEEPNDVELNVEAFAEKQPTPSMRRRIIQVDDISVITKRLNW